MHSELPPGHLAVPHRKSCGCKVTNHGIGRHYLAIAAHNRGGLRRRSLLLWIWSVPPCGARSP
jgi:hypothetical protein